MAEEQKRREGEEEEIQDDELALPATEPPKRKNFRTDMGNSAPIGRGPRSFSSVSGSSRRSTAVSTTSSGGLQTLPLATQPSLKGPYEGQKIAPLAKVTTCKKYVVNTCFQPDEALAKALEQLGDEDWEKNVDGLLLVLRLATHHPETIMVEYKSTTQLLLKQVFKRHFN